MRRATGLLATMVVLSVVGVGCSNSSSSLAHDCRGHDLVVTKITHDGNADLVQLRNASNSKCSLSGYPQSITGTTDAGSAKIEFTHTTYTPSPRPGSLKPSSTGIIVLEHKTTCAQPVDGAAYSDVQLFVPGGGVITLDNFTIDGRCGIAASRLGLAP